MSEPQHFNAVVIGSGFGGTMTALPLAREFKKRGLGESILILERGTWWTTPVGTVQDKEVATYDFLAKTKGQPVQYWPSQNHFGGFLDIFTRCRRTRWNYDGLYELMRMGTTGFWSVFRPQNDGVSVLAASGVGGGSLVYSNITIRPPELIFNDDRWQKPMSWTLPDRDGYYDLARNAIGKGVLFALDQRDGISPPTGAVNTGLSNIATRTAALNPHWLASPDPRNPRGHKQINLPRTKLNPTSPGLPPGDDKRDFANDLWLDRARVFQTAMDGLADEYGTVDSSINDYDYANPGNQYDGQGAAKNYCERQGRCNVGCLPGARHTLNKQLMVAIHGKPPNVPPLFQNITLEPLALTRLITARPSGGYEIEYEQYLPQGRRIAPRPKREVITADLVIVAAGCLGTNELLLKCQEEFESSKGRRGLSLSSRLGKGFSTNGDYLAFLDGTKERVNLIKGPVTTSHALFNTNDPGTKPDAPRFHILEDQGVPPALASIAGAGVPLIRSLTKGRNSFLLVAWALLCWAFARFRHLIRAPFLNYLERQDEYRSEEEDVAKLLCVVGAGREDSVGEFRLGKGLGDTPLRVKRSDGKAFHDDPVYTDIKNSLAQLAPRVRDPKDPKNQFINPFLTNVLGNPSLSSITLSHPLGGCAIGKTAQDGVVDEFGRAFRSTGAIYENLYVADASIMPTALGVNPSLTISALALRIADHLTKNLPPPPPPGAHP